MTREEAIEILRNNVCNSHLVYDNAMPTIIEALEVLIPELVESDDERVRRWIKKELEDKYVVEGIVNNKLADEAFGWLEKQKHLYETTKDRFYREGFEEGQLYERQKEQKPNFDTHWENGSMVCEQKEQKPILEVFGFKVGDAVRLKDGDRRKHIIKSFEEVEGLHGPNFYHVEFEDNSARDSICPGEEYPNGYYTQMEKFEEEQEPKVEVYEVGKGTTICGQDYKCKKDYRSGVCWYIKDAIYHCGRDGYLTDQNGVSWSCTPEWFNEYIQSNTEWAEEEKNRFVSGQFLQCKLSFDGFKEGEHYWLEYAGDDMYVGRSDNILNQKFHITPRQLYTLFSQQLEEVQGPPQEEKQASLTYEPPFNENPSDEEIIEVLIRHLNEQDGFLTAINCVSTKAILDWLKKQKEQKPSVFPPGLGEVRWNPISSVQQKPTHALTKDQYVEKFRFLCDLYDIKLPNRTYDIYHLCDDLAELFGNTNNQE